MGEGIEGADHRLVTDGSRRARARPLRFSTALPISSRGQTASVRGRSSTDLGTAMACQHNRRRRLLVFAMIAGTIGIAGSFASMTSSGAASATSSLLNRATSTTMALAPVLAANAPTSRTTLPTSLPTTPEPIGTTSTLPTAVPTTTVLPKRKSGPPVNRLPLAVASDSNGRMIALNEMPDGWTTRPVNAAAAPFDCRHLQPAMGAPVRTERVGFIGPSGQSVIERLDVFRDELTALRARDRLVRRLNECTTATFLIDAETFRFERQPVSVQSETGPDSIAAWRESTFDTSPVGESEFFFLRASGPTVVSLWTSTEKPVSDHRDLITTAASVAFEAPACKMIWKVKGLRRCSDAFFAWVNFFRYSDCCHAADGSFTMAMKGKLR